MLFHYDLAQLADVHHGGLFLELVGGGGGGLLLVHFHSLIKTIIIHNGDAASHR